MEIFKRIEEYPMYSVSTEGRVMKNSNRKIMKSSVKPNGYMQINLFTCDGRRKKEYVHRLVALTFLPNDNRYPEVNHIDGVRCNNSLGNLEWVTRSENVRKSSVPKTVVLKNGEGEIVAKFPCITDAVKELGLTGSNISACLHGRQKTHKGYSFEF